MLIKSVIFQFILISNIYLSQILCQPPPFESEEHLINWLGNEYEQFASGNCYRQQNAEWDYATDIGNPDKAAALTQVTLEVAESRKQWWQEYFEPLDVDDYEDEQLKRQLMSLKNLGSAALSAEKLEEYTGILQSMRSTYSTGKICPYAKQDCDPSVEGLSLEPDIEAVIASSTDYDELEYVWKAWRDASGAKIRDDYKKYVELSQEVAAANGFQDTGDMWRSRYETENFVENLEKLWVQVEPLYDELHTYVRNKLQERYGDKIDTSDGYIPANILGNMWAQSWMNIEPYVRPYPDASEVDVTEAMKQNGYDVLKMFEMSDEFYKSMGLLDNSMSYDSDAMITKPEGREVQCHASAWDFCDGETFRIKMCTQVDMEDFVTVHHEMGHIQYFLQYKNQKISFRGGANPGFHEAIGDTIALSVATPQHLEKIGLLTGYEDNEEASINALMNMALERVAFLPFGLLIDKWRWDVFSESIEESQWNEHWWNYRKLYQKVKPPVERTEHDFDPGAKFHVAANSQYINYFVAHILEFQFYRSLCIEAGEYNPNNPDTKPLYKCDFYGSTEAGARLASGMALGSSVHWSQVLQQITGETELDGTAITDYFKPLYDYLREYNNQSPPFQTEEELIDWLGNEYEQFASENCYRQQVAEWNYATDIANTDKADILTEVTLEVAEKRKEWWEQYFAPLNVDVYADEQLKRQLRSLKNLGSAALTADKLEEYTNVLQSMRSTYSTGKICPYAKQDCDLLVEGLSLEPDIEAVIASSTDYDELEYVWKAWRDASGAKIRDDYKKYVDLSQEVAAANGFQDTGDMWRSRYETENFVENLDGLWLQVEPLYDELHTYVRNKLQERYGDKIDTSDGYIPANILGNMWAQSWVNIEPYVRPYPGASEVDVTEAMKQNGYDVLKMFEMSDEFYKSMGLLDNSMSYDSDAMITKPEGREVQCHASAWDFCDGETFRIKMCTQVDMEDFVTVHHEMGHIQYYLQYKDQKISFRGGANPGFHEAIGDTIALSVATPQHLEKIGLLTGYEDNEEASINALMNMALERVAFLPFGLLIDKWRWDVFSESIEESQWNEHWWNYRKLYQKVKPPVERTEHDFDPGAKFHVAANSQYINYFVAHILEFQFYRSLCIEAGEYNPNNPDTKPLHKCDFYGSTEAGARLASGMALGSSVHWSQVLQQITGETELDGTAITDYFKPLYDYLREYNNQSPPFQTEEELIDWLGNEYEQFASENCYRQQVAEWNYATDIANTDKADILTEVTLEVAEKRKEWWEQYFAPLNVDVYADEQLKRQLRSLKNLGSAALTADKLEEYTNVLQSMRSTYSTGKICPYAKQDCDLLVEGLSLEPDIEAVIASSTDYDELEYVWKAWRDASGAKIRDDYKKYVDLSQEVAAANGFQDTGDMWRSRYETENFVENLDGLWLQVEPLYDELHTYVRNKLQERYGDKIDTSDGYIPANILGNMWAQSWVNIEPYVRPYPGASEVDVTEAMKQNGYDVLKMFEMSDEFYKSMGLLDNSMSYDSDAMITKPEGREVQCHASAWDFCDGETFRIKMCTQVDMEDFVTVHHEMGHIQYYLQYKDQKISFRGGANPGFHEAIGDTIALSVATPQHLEKIGLLTGYEDKEEASINALMNMALERVAFLPFGLLIDKWRWDVFSESIEESQWNEHWWNYRKLYQKVKPPVERAEHDFDPGAKFHVAANSQYINYFVAHILEFQFYRSLCIEAGEYDPNNPDTKPLHKCDFYGSTEAGARLASGMALGSSVHWSQVLQQITGETELDGTAITDYFKPLYDYLREYNNQSPPFQTEEELIDWLGNEYEQFASENCYRQQVAEWNYATDIANTDKADILTEVTLEVAEKRKEWWEQYFAPLNVDVYADEQLKRQLRSLKNLGSAALTADKLEEYTNVLQSMRSTYSTGKICPYAKQDCDLLVEGLSLEPDIEAVIASSTDYDELEYVWKAWRDASGAKIRDDYKKYVDLSQEVAAANGFQDTGDMWRSRYETENFVENLDGLWLQVESLYDELHTYVRNKLQERYGDKIDTSDGYIPANILGNMWAQSWVNIEPYVRPYPGASEVDVTEAMKQNGYDVLKMFEMSDEFYKSMGLLDNSMSYDSDAMITKPEGREVQCHASAWDFCDGETFRIKMCTQVDMEDFVTVHHEMGHIQYYLQYKDQKISFRGGANPGFHEAIGDTIALSVATPQHLEKIGLLTGYEDNEEASINALMNMALERVAFLPFGLLIDKWRWDVFSESIEESQWNDHWWNYRKLYQKVKPPVERAEHDFDPGAKFHVAANSQYINYFVAHILEFQFYRSLCIEAGEYDPNNPDTKPLHKCDFYGSTEAGARLASGMALGSSVHWSQVLQQITGETELDGTAITDYFKPLYDYLREYNNQSPPFQTEEELIDWLGNEYEQFASENCYRQQVAEWNYATDIDNPDKAAALTEVTLEVAEKRKEWWERYFAPLNVDDYQNEPLKRQLRSLKNLGSAALSTNKLEEYTNILQSMRNTYSTAKICPFAKQDCILEDEGLSLEPDMEAVIASSTDYDELTYVWKAWRDASGAKIREDYQKYIQLSQEVAAANGFEDTGEMWRSRYETDDFIESLDELWLEVKPLYDELHTYVRRKLQDRFGDKIDTSDGYIPANVLGNMWAQSWVNIEPYVKPFPDASEVDITQAMLQNGYDVRKMFEMSNEFYTSLGLLDNSMSYGADAMITKPDGREVQCHASAWDFCDGETFRIKMCTEVNMEDFITVHHEMGHIQYFLQYRNQPITFRGGANPGFHEAMGDTIALSMATPQHLEKIGLLTDYEDTDEASINALMGMALERVAFLPFGLLIDKWRWDVFSGSVDESQWNEHWWNYRKLYQKVKSPVERTEDDFDPGAKFHVAANSQYINYFVAHILEFQLYRAICQFAGEYQPNNATGKPLHKCDFYNNPFAGTRFRTGMTLGSSLHWSQVLLRMTGASRLDGTAILDYFKPLYDYLYKYNRELGEEDLQDFLSGDYARQAQEVYTAQVHAEWNYATNINEETGAALNEATLRMAAFDKEQWENVFSQQNEESFTDEMVRRQLKFLKVLGNAALDEEKLSELTNAISEMTEIYSSATICPYENQQCEASERLTLEPGIEEIMSTSTAYEKLQYAWTAWRDVSGAKMKAQFETYVNLSNEAARANGFADKSGLWLSSFESDTFIEDPDKLWEEVEPLYDELHFYVSRKLKTRYGDDLDLGDLLLPAHVLGNMWAQSWVNLASLVKPYPDVNPVDITTALVENGYTVEQMFEVANEFYTSLGLESCEMSYGEGAMITRPNDGRDVVCHASAWDFYDGETFRVKMCTEVNYEDFVTIHHELGHIEYYLLYKDKPITLRTGANPGFHEAVGDTIALSVATPKHFNKIGLLPDYVESEQADINSLMDMALERVAFLPFGLLIDKWRWDVFAGTVSSSEWNDHWWHYRKTIQKVKPPVDRSELDFDPGAKFHVAADYQYISYFVAHILEFQFYRALCIAAGEYDPEDNKPLHRCDYYESLEAGELLREALSLGALKHWEDVLEILTGQRNMDTSAILEYFAPLYEYLQEQNSNIPEDELKSLISVEYERGAIRAFGAVQDTSWQYDIDLGGMADAQIEAILAAAAFRKSWINIINRLNEASYSEDIRTQLSRIIILHDAAVDDSSLVELTSILTDFKKLYGNAQLCPYEISNCNLENYGKNEEVMQIAMAVADDPEELLYLWEGWRDITGQMVSKNVYARYVQLANSIAQANGYADRGDQWRSQFEIDNLVGTIDDVWSKVEPLYGFLHAFAMKRLKSIYENLDIEDELIPAHVLRSLWSESWWNLTEVLRPYPNADVLDITTTLRTSALQIRDVLNKVDDFFAAIGLQRTQAASDSSNVLGRIGNNEMTCEAKTWDLLNGEYRVKMCPSMNRPGYILNHKMLSHLQYFMLYKEQAVTFRNAPNPALYDAIGGAFALAAITPAHLKGLQLIDDFEDSEEADLNLLMDVALETLPSLAFALVVDKWRWDVFAGQVNQNQWNARWWQYSQDFQKIKQPVSRSESNFDAASKYHILADEPYITHFISTILQFQIHRALCIEAGQYDPESNDPPIHRCTFTNSQAVGTLLRDALSAGSLKHWSEVLESITGETEMDPSAMLEYFAPLYDYLEKGSSVMLQFSLVTYLCSFSFVYFVPRLLW